MLQGTTTQKKNFRGMQLGSNHGPPLQNSGRGSAIPPEKPSSTISVVVVVVVVVVITVVMDVVVSIAPPQTIALVDQVVSPDPFLVAETSAIDLVDGAVLLLPDSGLDG